MSMLTFLGLLMMMLLTGSGLNASPQQQYGQQQQYQQQQQPYGQQPFYNQSFDYYANLGDSYFRQFNQKHPEVVNSVYNTIQNVDWKYYADKVGEVAADRTYDINDINFDEIANRLITPKGLITQFALNTEIQIIAVLGWIGSGILWQFLLSVTDGEIQAFLRGLGFLFSTQALAVTVARSVFQQLREFVMRILVGITFFGGPAVWEEIVNTTIYTIGNFLFNPGLVILIAARATLTVVMLVVQQVLVLLFATNIYPFIRPPGLPNNPDYGLGRLDQEMLDDNSTYSDTYDWSDDIDRDGIIGYSYLPFKDFEIHEYLPDVLAEVARSVFTAAIPI